MKDGAPAYPRPDNKGMSLRDWFAGMAIGYVGTLKIESARTGVPLLENDWSQKGIATLAFDIADAMLAERDRHEDADAK